MIEDNKVIGVMDDDLNVVCNKCKGAVKIPIITDTIEQARVFIGICCCIENANIKFTPASMVPTLENLKLVPHK
jgi:hypothetical protein